MRSDGLKESFARALDRAVAGAEGGHAVAALHASGVDDILRDLFARAVDRPDGLCLIALGGYGRRELAPYSDLDLLLVHRRPVDDVNRSLFYPLWDAGRDVGNRVRDFREAVKVPARIDEAISLLDARPIAGDHDLYTEWEGAVERGVHRACAQILRSLREATLERHQASGHLGHLLEPDIRDSAGGLRDIHVLGWLRRLADVDMVSDVLAAHGFLLDARIELHLLAGRRQDRLYLSEQDPLAERLGYRGEAGPPPGDAFVRDLYLHAREVDQIVTSAWDRTVSRRRWRRRPPAPLALPSPKDDPAPWLAVFLRSAREGGHVPRESLERLRSLCDGAQPIAWTPDAREAFMQLLADGADRALEAMDASGFLAALLPEWKPVRCCPQRNLYHRFTVDVHLVTTVAELAASRRSDEPDVQDAWSHVASSEPALLLGAFLHDIGKGRGGDHVLLGPPVAASVAGRMGFEGGTVEDIVFLVREHLTLAELAMRRDLADEGTAEEVAERTGDVRRLAMLFLLTRADAIATGPEAWSPFRASLIRELYAKALRVLALEPVRQDGERREEIVALLRERGLDPGLAGRMPLAWLGAFEPQAAVRQLEVMSSVPAHGGVRTLVTPSGEADELIVVAGDRPGLFATVSGVLAARGIEVLSADIFTRNDGLALEVFRVKGAHGPIERWESVRSDLSRAIAGRFDVAAAIRQRPARRHHLDPAAKVVIDNDTSDFHTIVEVHATDRPGLLHTITDALARAGCDLHRARIATYGLEVVDVFYVRDVQGQKIGDPDAVAAIERTVLAALA